MSNKPELARVEAFLEALRHNPQAPAPAEIDADYAQFLRLLISHEQPHSTMMEATMQAKVWAQVQRADSQSVPKAVKPSYSFTFALTLAMLFIMAIIGIASLRGNTTDYLAGADNTPTPHQLIDMTITSTPLSSISSWTPTPIPLSTALPPNVLTAEAAISTPTIVDEPEMTATPLSPVLPPTAVPPMPDVTVFTEQALNQRINGELATSNSQHAYVFTIPRRGILFSTLSSADLSVNQSFNYAAGDANGGGGGGGGNMYTSRSDLFALVEANSTVTITVSSVDSQAGQYTLGVYLMPMDDDEKISNLAFGAKLQAEVASGDRMFQWNPDFPVRGFLYQGVAGSLVNVQVQAAHDLALSIWKLPTVAGQFVIYNNAANGIVEAPLCTQQPGDLFCVDLNGGRGNYPEFNNVLLQQQGLYLVLLWAENDKLTESVSGADSTWVTIWGGNTFPVALEVGTTQTLTLDNMTPAAVASVTAKQGDTIAVKVTALNGYLPIKVSLTTQEGQVLDTIELTDRMVATLTVQAPADDKLLIVVQEPLSSAMHEGQPAVIYLSR